MLNCMLSVLQPQIQFPRANRPVLTNQSIFVSLLCSSSRFLKYCIYWYLTKTAGAAYYIHMFERLQLQLACILHWGRTGTPNPSTESVRRCILTILAFHSQDLSYHTETRFDIYESSLYYWVIHRSLAASITSHLYPVPLAAKVFCSGTGFFLTLNRLCKRHWSVSSLK